MVRKIAYTTSAGAFVVILGIILVLVYFIASNHNTSWDLSRTGSNTLDTRTTNVLNSLDVAVEITVFDKEGPEKRHAQDIMDLYSTGSKRITYRIIDPDARPGMARQYGVDRYGQAVLTAGSRQSLIERVTEENLTNALVKLMRDKKQVIYLITGHGERDISHENNQGISQLGTALALDDVEVHPHLLMSKPGIPSDADLIVVAGPRKKFLAEELEIIRTYLAGGGNMLVTLEPGGNAGLDELLGDYGIILDGGIVIDTLSTLVGGDYTVPVVNTYGDMPEIKGFAYATLFPTSRALMIKKELSPDLEVTWIARTSKQSWSETDFATLFDEGKADRSAEETPGPLNIAVCARRAAANNLQTSLMVFGDTDFLTNAYLNVSGNKDLAFTCINMLLGEGHMITIDAKSPGDRPFILTPGQSRMIFWVPVVVIPVLILTSALVVFWMRRRA